MKIVLIVLFSLFISACASTKREQSAAEVSMVDPVILSHQDKRIPLLMAQYREWQGTPYQYGGISRSGVDCSGFVFRTYKDKLARLLPRTTAEQAELGHAVGRANLQAGDLVFFNTAKKVRHVGIYTEKNQFIHASSTKGVMISSLAHPYWSSRFWMARRP